MYSVTSPVVVTRFLKESLTLTHVEKVHGSLPRFPPSPKAGPCRLRTSHDLSWVGRLTRRRLEEDGKETSCALSSSSSLTKTSRWATSPASGCTTPSNSTV